MSVIKIKYAINVPDKKWIGGEIATHPSVHTMTEGIKGVLTKTKKALGNKEKLAILIEWIYGMAIVNFKIDKFCHRVAIN